MMQRCDVSGEIAWLVGAQAYIRQEPMSPLPFRLAVCLMTGRGQLDMAADAAEQVQKKILWFALAKQNTVQTVAEAKLRVEKSSLLIDLLVSQRLLWSCNFRPPAWRPTTPRSSCSWASAPPGCKGLNAALPTPLW